MKAKVSSPILLKGTEFDKAVKAGIELSNKVSQKLRMEEHRPGTWTKEQVDDLGDIHDILAYMYEAIWILADKARDD